MNRTTFQPHRPKRAHSARHQLPGFKQGVLAAIILSGLILGALMATYVYVDDLLDRFDRVFLDEPVEEMKSFSLQLSDIVAYEDKSGQLDSVGVLDDLRREQTKVQITEIRSKNGVRNVLLIISDAWDDDQVNRPDAIVLLTLAHGANQVRLTTFLNTMTVDIPQKGWSMLSHAYSWGGAELLCETMEHNFRIDLHDFLVIESEAFESAIDRVGGVGMKLTLAEETYLRKNYPYREIKKGETEMNGELAVAFCRTRLSDDEMDRLERQRRVALALIDEAQELSRKRLNSLVISAFSKTRTNLTNAQLFSLMTDGYKARHYVVRQLTIPTEGAYRTFVYNQVRMTRADLEANVSALHEFVFHGDS